MKKALGIAFALALFLLPASQALRAQDTLVPSPEEATTSAATSTPAVPAGQNGPFGFMQQLLSRFIGDNAQSSEDAAAAKAVKSRLSAWQKRIEDFLNRLNNTF